MSARTESEYFKLGQREQWRGDYNMAVQYYQRALRDEPENASIWWEQGLSLAHLGRGPEAKASWEKAASLDPQYARIYEEKKEQSRKARDAKEEVNKPASVDPKPDPDPASSPPPPLEGARTLTAETTPEAAAAITGSEVIENPVAVETKQCPRCAEMIKAEARLCRFCGARFEVSLRGYCSTDHAMVDVDEQDKCKKCGSTVLDAHLESRLISETESIAESKPVLENRPRPSVDVVEWVIEPIRGEGVNWRFNGVFLDMILIELIYVLIAALFVGLGSALSGNMEDLMPLFSGGVLLLLPAIWFAYFALFETISGATPGKRASFVKVIRKDGGKIEWWQALIRAFFGLFEYNIIGAIFVWSTPLKQRLGDLIAGTLVVNRDKLYKIAFQPDCTTFDFHDFRHFEFAKITEGIIHKFGLARQITLMGVTFQGIPVTLRWNAQFQRAEVERIRLEIERRYDIVFAEKIIIWRLIVVIFALAVLCGVLALVLTMINQ